MLLTLYFLRIWGWKNKIKNWTVLNLWPPFSTLQLVICLILSSYLPFLLILWSNLNVIKDNLKHQQIYIMSPWVIFIFSWCSSQWKGNRNTWIEVKNKYYTISMSLQRNEENETNHYKKHDDYSSTFVFFLYENSLSEIWWFGHWIRLTVKLFK